MNEDQQNLFTHDRMQLIKLVKIIAILVIAFLALAIVAKARGLSYIGSSASAANTITVSGVGDVEKAPDTAKISFTVMQESKAVADAQSAVTTKINTITKALEALGIAEGDIKTDSYSSYPQYDYPSVAPCVPNGPCGGGGTPVLRAYQVSHSITVSVKDLDNVSDVLKVLGDNNASDISGPNFGFADDHSVANEARDAAIVDAKNQATILAKSLGVHLVRIVSFSEDNGAGNPVPLYKAMDSVASGVAVPAPTLPTGTQKVSSNVTIVYEIR